MPPTFVYSYRALLGPISFPLGPSHPKVSITRHSDAVQNSKFGPFFNIVIFNVYLRWPDIKPYYTILFVVPSVIP